MIPIILSWFISPLLAALITLIMFVIVRTAVLRRANSTKLAFYLMPIFVLVCIFINLFFVLVSGNADSGGVGGCRGGCRVPSSNMTACPAGGERRSHSSGTPPTPPHLLSVTALHVPLSPPADQGRQEHCLAGLW